MSGASNNRGAEIPLGWILISRAVAWYHVILGTALIGDTIFSVWQGPSDVTIPVFVLALVGVMGPLLLVAGVGLLWYRPWGRVLAIVLAIVIGGYAFVALIVFGVQQQAAFGAFHLFVTVGLLTLRNVRRLYGVA
ncbi:MAG: hypothetical protein NZ518_09745 [Dehalococcoidia bacterium]|nr:hypothetical protein [Dehalococcoidia bacterium]